MVIQINSQMALPISLDDRASFDNYFSGNNLELVEALKASIDATDTSILFFYGVSGSGKSHLMFALQRLAFRSETRSSYISLSEPQVSGEMLEILDPSPLLCIDNVDAWAGNEQNEIALFALFERIKQSKGRLIVSAKNPPDSCGFALKDLISRLSSGLVYPVHRLDDSQCFEAIKLRAHQRGLRISDDVVSYLLSRTTRDTTELFDLLDRIDKASLVEKRRITIPFLQTLFSK